MRILRSAALIAGTVLAGIASVTAETPSLQPDLLAAAAGKGWTIVNRSVEPTDMDRPALRLDGAGGIGLARLEHGIVGDGAIALDVALRPLGNLLDGIAPNDRAVFGGVAVLILVIASLRLGLPGRQGGRALRSR